MQGHNSGEQIKAFISRIENLEVSKKSLSIDIADVYGEAKSSGFDAKIIRKIIALRKKSAEARREEQELLELYNSAGQLGLFD